MSAALKLEVSNFSLHLLGFDADRSGPGNAFWFGVSLVKTGTIFTAIVCFFLVRSQVLLNAVFGREMGFCLVGFGFGFLFLILSSCIVSTSSCVRG